jgi:hypothetical protein
MNWNFKIKRAPFVAGLFIGAAVICWCANRSMQLPLGKPGSLSPVRTAPVTPARIAHAHEGWLAVRAFEHLMDSLRDDIAGRHRYDSILLARPGILDSAKTAEAFFYLHDH